MRTTSSHKYRKSGGNKNTELQDKMQGAKQDVQKDVQTTAQTSVKGAQDAMKDVESTARNAMKDAESTVKGAQDAMQNVQNTAKNALQDAQGALQGAKGALQSVMLNPTSQLKDMFSGPHVAVKVGAKIDDVAEMATVALKIAEPGIDRIVDESTEIMKKQSPKIVAGLSRMIQDATMVIPGVPLIYEIIDGATTAAKVGNTAGELATTTMATVMDVEKELEGQLHKTTDSMNRIRSTGEEFMGTNKQGGYPGGKITRRSRRTRIRTKPRTKTTTTRTKPRQRTTQRTTKKHVRRIK